MLSMNQINWKMMLFEGVLFTLLGLFALTHPFIMTLSLNILLGSVLIAVGIIQGFRSLKNIKEAGAAVSLISAAFALIAGILLIGYPLTGMITLTFLLTVYFFVEGFTRMIAAFQLKPLKGWVWVLFSGFLSLLLAVLILNGMPTSAFWVFGLYLGIYMLFLGISLIGLSISLKGTVGREV